MMSALLSGASASVGAWLFEKSWPSRQKMRSSMPVSAAMRANMGTSRRQSDDQSSDRTSIFAGGLGWATNHFNADACSSVSREVANASREKGLLFTLAH